MGTPGDSIGDKYYHYHERLPRDKWRGCGSPLVAMPKISDEDWDRIFSQTREKPSGEMVWEVKNKETGSMRLTSKPGQVSKEVTYRENWNKIFNSESSALVGGAE